MNSSFEMSRLFNQTNIPNGQQNSGRSSSLRVPQYTLQDVEFVEELGEGAFGKCQQKCFLLFEMEIVK